MKIERWVDRSKVEAHLRELKHDLEEGAVGWMLPRFLRLSLLGTVVTVVFPALASGNLGDILNPSTVSFWIRWFLPTVLAAPSVWGHYLWTRKRVERGAESLALEIRNQWLKWTGKGWIRRTLVTGAGMTAAVGGSVGLLISTLFPLSELPGGSRVTGFLGFVAVTALWTFPMAFGIRWISLRSNRPFLRIKPGPEQPAEVVENPSHRR